MEVPKVWGNMFLVIHRLRVLLEGLSQPLRDSGSCTYMLRFRKKPSGPDAVTIFKGLIRWVSCVLIQVILITCVLNEGRKGACTTGINALGICLLGFTFFSDFHPATSTASR